MSSEGTVSVVGSEVMPLDYGSMDSKSSPSPSSSKKTVEGVRGDEVVEVGGNEMVGVEGDSVPITVVEVEGKGDRGYEIDVDIVEEVKQYRSELRTKDSLGHLVENYEISSRVLVRPTGVEERACSAPRDHWMPVYAHYLIARLRFPIPELLVGLLLDYGIGLTQLVPNAMRGGSRKDKGCLNEDEEEEVGKLVRKGGDLLNIMDLTSAQCIEVAELYGPSALSEAEMDQFLNTAGGVVIPKKPRKKSKTSTKQVDEGRAGKEVVPTASAETEEELEEGAEVRAPGKGKGPVPPMAFQSSLFKAKNMTGARWFINTTFPEVDKRNARDEALRYCGASVVKHVLESASWVNGLAQEFMDSVKERSLLQRQCDQLQKEKEELEKKNKELQEELNEREAQAKEIALMKDAFVELKENVQMLVHNGMKEHISNFISSSSFDNIVNLYRLPTAIIAFTDCRKKVKAEYPEVDITKITFGEQEKGVEEDGESMSANFRPQLKLRWEHDADGRAVFPPQFDFEFVAVEEEGAEVEEDEVEAGVEGAEVDESQPVPKVEIHPVPSNDEQPPLPDEQQPTQPPLPAEQEPVEPPLPAEK
ncbi:hypothetical protein SLEP1_g43171 [Rubroshorea leprosula]|uniref:Uncharacterized protein n=1 Tax=Rubroshorea leprosula TaxID=152421 RepID=A0AAV5LCJ2_9ROSI|nr:hypothetical protein SLEP1_g43171 [Rubroshorea leprosula]